MIVALPKTILHRDVLKMINVFKFIFKVNFTKFQLSFFSLFNQILVVSLPAHAGRMRNNNVLGIIELLPKIRLFLMKLL